MKTICAWCLKLIDGDANSTVISHGICEECSAKFFPEGGKGG